MKTLISLSALTVILAVAGCQSDAPQHAGYSVCYHGETDRDTTSLWWNEEGGQVKGEMEARYFQMDPQRGKLKGHWRGDTLNAEFHYQWEGKPVIREVHFLRTKDGELVEGFGERIEVDGKQVYANSGFLNYHHVLKLRPIECR